MTKSKLFIIGGVVIAALLVAVLFVKKDIFYNNKSISSIFNSKGSNSSDSDIIGTFNGVAVKKSELSAQEKQSLFEAESQVYKAEEGILAQKYMENIISEYGKTKGIKDINQAQRQYMTDNIKISPVEINNFITQNKDNPSLKGKPKAEQENMVQAYLMREKAGTYFRNLIAEAKTQGLIKVTGAKLPELPRVKIEIGDSPTIGPKNAPITLVEFADFQCPFCYSAEPTVKAIMAKYKDKIKLVFKNYPLISLHPQAVNASMAAECAQEQGKFWEMHDILFENHAKLADNVYSNFAKTVGLNIKNFDTCYTNPATKEKVMQQEAYGQSLGINATPAFYINGILLMGAQPESEFIATIDKELENKNM